MSASRRSHRRAHSEILIASASTQSLRTFLHPPSFLRIPFLSHHRSEPHSDPLPPLNDRFVPFKRPAHRRSRDTIVSDSAVDVSGESDADSLFSVRSSTEPVSVAAHALIAELEAVITQLASKNAALRRQRALLRAAIVRVVRELQAERRRKQSPTSRRTPKGPFLPSPSAHSQGSSSRTDVTPTPVATFGESSGGSGGSALGDLIAALQEKNPRSESHYSLASRTSSDIMDASSQLSSQLSRTRPSLGTSTDELSRRRSGTTVSSPPSVRSASTRNSMIRITTGVKPRQHEPLPPSPSIAKAHTRTETLKAPRTVGAPIIASSPATGRPLSYQKRLDQELGNVPEPEAQTKSTKIPVLNNFRSSARRLRDTLSRRRSVKTQDPA